MHNYYHFLMVKSLFFFVLAHLRPTFLDGPRGPHPPQTWQVQRGAHQTGGTCSRSWTGKTRALAVINWQ